MFFATFLKSERTFVEMSLFGLLPVQQFYGTEVSICIHKGIWRGWKRLGFFLYFAEVVLSFGVFCCHC